MSHLSQCAKLHDDPDWVLSDDPHQLHDVWVVELTHGHCRDRDGDSEGMLVSLAAFFPLECCIFQEVESHEGWESYRLLGGTFP